MTRVWVAAVIACTSVCIPLALAAGTHKPIIVERFKLDVPTGGGVGLTVGQFTLIAHHGAPLPATLGLGPQSGAIPSGAHMFGIVIRESIPSHGSAQYEVLLAAFHSAAGTGARANARAAVTFPPETTQIIQGLINKYTAAVGRGDYAVANVHLQRLIAFVHNETIALSWNTGSGTFIKLLPDPEPTKPKRRRGLLCGPRGPRGFNGPAGPAGPAGPIGSDVSPITSRGNGKAPDGATAAAVTAAQALYAGLYVGCLGNGHAVPAGVGRIFADLVGAGLVTLTVEKAGTGNGTVNDQTGNGGIDCFPAGSKGNTQPKCTNEYAPGTRVILDETPDNTSVFAGWSLAGCDTANSCQFTINANMTVKATFDKNPNISSSVKVAFAGHPFSAALGSFIPGASSFAPSDPTNVYALATDRSGTEDYVAAFNTATHHVAGFVLPMGPNWVGITRVGPGDTIAWAAASGQLNAFSFNDAGQSTGMNFTIDESSGQTDANIAMPRIFNFVNPAGGQYMIAAGTDRVTGFPAVVSATISSSGNVSSGPCPNPTTFNDGRPGISGVAFDPMASAFAFTGLLPSMNLGFFTTNGSCGNPTSAVDLGPNASMTLPAVGAAGGGRWFVYGAMPGLKTHQVPVIYKLDSTGSKVSGFTAFQGQPTTSATAADVFLDGTAAVAIGSWGSAGYLPALNPTTGALNSSVHPNPLTFLTPSSSSTTVASAQEPSNGTIVAFTNDSSGPGVTVLTGTPTGN